MEKILNPTEETFRKLFNTICGPAFIATLPDFEYVDVNDKFVEVSGYNREEIIGRTSVEMNLWPNYESCDAVTLMLNESGTLHDCKVEGHTKTGERIIGLLSGNTIRLNHDVAVLALLTEAFPHVLTKEKKRVTGEYCSGLLIARCLFCSSPNPTIVLDVEDSIAYVNPAFEALTGFRASQLESIFAAYPWLNGKSCTNSSYDISPCLCNIEGEVRKLSKRNGEIFWAKTYSMALRINKELDWHIDFWNDITEYKRLGNILELYAGEVTKAQEEERRRIARELHDGTAQALASIYVDVEKVISLANKERLNVEIVHHLDEMGRKIDSVLDEVRRFSHELRPAILDRFGLIASLESLVEEVNQTASFKCTLEVKGSRRRIPQKYELTLFRITQEALQNVRKHSEATSVFVIVTFAKDRIELKVSDNGAGFETPSSLSELAQRGKFGLLGMSERVRLLNGDFFVEPKLGKGTLLVAQIPI